MKSKTRREREAEQESEINEKLKALNELNSLSIDHYHYLYPLIDLFLNATKRKIIDDSMDFQCFREYANLREFSRIIGDASSTLEELVRFNLADVSQPGKDSFPRYKLDIPKIREYAKVLNEGLNAIKEKLSCLYK